MAWTVKSYRHQTAQHLCSCHVITRLSGENNRNFLIIYSAKTPPLKAFWLFSCFHLYPQFECNVHILNIQCREQSPHPAVSFFFFFKSISVRCTLHQQLLFLFIQIMMTLTFSATQRTFHCRTAVIRKTANIIIEVRPFHFERVVKHARRNILQKCRHKHIFPMSIDWRFQ